MTPLQQIEWRQAKLHLACGLKRLPAPWVNSDVQGGPDVLLDIVRDLYALPAGALAHIYWSHGPEHIAPDLLPGVFKQLHRVLAPDGRLTIAPTDLWAIVTRRFPDHNWEGPLFGHRRSTDSPYAAHFDCFTAEKLTRLLREAGFAAVRPWCMGSYPELAALGDYAATHADVTLYAEAVR